MENVFDVYMSNQLCIYLLSEIISETFYNVYHFDYDQMITYFKHLKVSNLDWRVEDKCSLIKTSGRIQNIQQ